MNVYVLGITGGVGCGKSTVLQYLKEAYGAVLIECDEVARELQQPGRACYEPIIRLFGDGIVKPDGTIVAEYRENCPETPGGFAVWKDRRMGSVRVRMYRRTNMEE